MPSAPTDSCSASAQAACAAASSSRARNRQALVRLVWAASRKPRAAQSATAALSAGRPSNAPLPLLPLPLLQATPRRCGLRLTTWPLLAAAGRCGCCRGGWLVLGADDCNHCERTAPQHTMRAVICDPQCLSTVEGQSWLQLACMLLTGRQRRRRQKSLSKLRAHGAIAAQRASHGKTGIDS